MRISTKAKQKPRDGAASPTLRELVKTLQPKLDVAIFSTNPKRAWFLVLAYASLALNLAVTFAWLRGDLPLVVWLVTSALSVNLGSWAFFVMHEAMHGAIFRSPLLTWLTAFFGGAPFLATPHVWRRWHEVHHRYTSGVADTDRFRHPAFDDFNMASTRAEHLVKRARYSHPISYIMPQLTVSFHHLLMFCKGMLGRAKFKLDRRRAALEFAATTTFAMLPLFTLPIDAAFFGIYLPLCGANTICGAYILSNHNTRPLTTQNRPLANSASVYLWRFLPWTHLGFGRHVEHHIFPSLTHDRLRSVTELLRREYPDQFLERSLFAELHALFGRQQECQEVVDSSVEAERLAG